MFKQIKKAVFPVAGMGTRFLPVTKANPKEMLPIVDKPLIQYAVEEAVAAGISELIFVTNSSKRAIEDHFDSNFELETRLADNKKQDLLEIVKNVLPEGVNCTYIRQRDPLGLGHAVLCAQNVVGDEPFAVLLADDLIDGSDQLCLQQMVQAYEKTGNSVIAVEQIDPSETNKYGVVALREEKLSCSPIKHIVEKPTPEEAPSNLGVVGRYLLTPRIFHHLANVGAGAGGEIQLTDAIAQLLEHETAYALQFSGKRFDCGSKLGYLQASIELGLKHPEFGEDFHRYLTQRFQ